MSFGLKRLNDVLTTATDRPADYPQLDANFVTYMDQAIDLITPISLQLTLDSGDQPPVEITETKVGKPVPFKFARKLRKMHGKCLTMSRDHSPFSSSR